MSTCRHLPQAKRSLTQDRANPRVGVLADGRGVRLWRASIPLSNSPLSSTLAAARQPERTNACGVSVAAATEVITDVPHRAVVARIDRRLRVVLPPHHVLRRFTFDENRLARREHTGRIASEPGGEALAGEMRTAPERISDADVAGAIDRGARHPSIQ